MSVKPVGEGKFQPPKGRRPEGGRRRPKSAGQSPKSVPPTKFSVRERANSRGISVRGRAGTGGGEGEGGRHKPKSLPPTIFFRPKEGKERGKLQALVGTPYTTYFCPTEGGRGRVGRREEAAFSYPRRVRADQSSGGVGLRHSSWGEGG